MNDSKPWYKSKTMWVNILSLALAAADQVAGTGLLPSWAMALLAGANVALRAITSEPIGQPSGRGA